MKKLGGILSAIAIAGMLVALAATPSDAARSHVRYLHSAYDGLWSVSIYTRNGSCSASYRYPVAIVGSRVVAAEGEDSFQVSGYVTHGGRIGVTVSQAGQSATGFGRLSRTTGTGWWRTASGECSGVWSAVRRQ
jgi:hypothetical protein